MELLVYVCSTYRLALCHYTDDEVQDFKADLARWSSSLERNVPALVNIVSSRLTVAILKLDSWLDKIGDGAQLNGTLYHATHG